MPAVAKQSVAEEQSGTKVRIVKLHLRGVAPYSANAEVAHKHPRSCAHLPARVGGCRSAQLKHGGKMKNGETVAAFERAFAEFVGAKHAIAMCNGTATLHSALVALGVKPGDWVAVPPLTMASTTIAVLHAGAVPVYVDVDPLTWTMEDPVGDPYNHALIPVSLYGLPCLFHGGQTVVDAAQTLQPHHMDANFPPPSFTSYSFQASKILALGEGGMLVTNDEELAQRAREFSSLGYRMDPDQPKIDPATLKSPTFARHHSMGWNYRMSDLVARHGLLELSDYLAEHRREAAGFYRQAIQGCDWITPQHVPEGWGHDYWTFAVATDTPERCLQLLDAVEKHGGERPYPAWRLTYHEPAFQHLVPLPGPRLGICPVAEDLQPRLCQFQTNNLESAERNAEALSEAIREIEG